MALALLGIALSFTRHGTEQFRWWSIMAVVAFGFVDMIPSIMRFNTRYAILFMLPFWVLAASAYSHHFIASSLL